MKEYEFEKRYLKFKKNTQNRVDHVAGELVRGQVIQHVWPEQSSSRRSLGRRRSWYGWCNNNHFCILDTRGFNTWHRWPSPCFTGSKVAGKSWLCQWNTILWGQSTIQFTRPVICNLYKLVQCTTNTLLAGWVNQQTWLNLMKRGH